MNQTSDAPISSSPMPLPTSTLAIVSLISGILGFILLPIICSIVALITGYQARKETRAVPPQATGDGLATAGIIMGYIQMALFVIACLVIAVLMILGPVIGNVFSSINQSMQSAP
jgi:uncharacterized membrane protein